MTSQPISARTRRHREWGELLWGLVPSTVIVVCLAWLADAASYQPAALLLIGCVLAAASAGPRAAASSVVAATLAMWWAFTPGLRSWTIATWPAAIGLLLFTTAASTIVVVVLRIRSAPAATERSAVALLQAAAIPSSLPDLVGVRMAAVYQPADREEPIGGDWYDAFVLDDERIALVIADVAGHGRHAAVFMVQVRNVFRALADEYHEPGRVLTRANDITSRLNAEAGPFVTCCFATLHVGSGTLWWAQAGHFSPILLSADGSSQYLPERTGPPLALHDHCEYESSSVAIQRGDRILMFTDGLVERRREHLDVGIARLTRAASTHSSLTPDALVRELTSSVIDRYDDLALLCVALEGGGVPADV